MLVNPCTKRGDKELAYNDSPRGVEQLHRYIKESDENNEEVLCDMSTDCDLPRRYCVTLMELRSLSFYLLSCQIS